MATRTRSFTRASTIPICFTRIGRGDIQYIVCVSPRDLPEQLTVYPDQVIGAGNWGTVMAGDFGGRPVAVKFMSLDVPIPNRECGTMDDLDGNCHQASEASYRKEVQFIRIAADIGIGPALVYSSIVPVFETRTIPTKRVEILLTQPRRVALLVTERFPGITLSDYIRSYTREFLRHRNEIREKFVAVFELLASYGLESNDTHFGNVLINPRTLDLSFIDNFFVPLYPGTRIRTIRAGAGETFDLEQKYDLENLE